MSTTTTTTDEPIDTGDRYRWTHGIPTADLLTLQDVPILQGSKPVQCSTAFYRELVGHFRRRQYGIGRRPKDVE